MATINLTKVSGASVNKPILDVLGGSAADKTTVGNALNGALKTVLTNSATSTQQTALVNLLETLSPVDLAAEQNLSLRDFVTKNTTLPTDPAARQAAETAIATLSPTTTVGALLGLSGTVSSNPIFSGMVAQTNLSTLLSTSSALAVDKVQTDFLAKYVSFQGSTQDFWTQLGQDDEFKSLVPELQFTMQLGVLSLNNPPLVAALRNTYKPSSMRDLTKLDASALTQLVTSQNVPIPDSISGTTPAEKTANYVSGMIALLQSAFPTDYVAQGLAASKDATQQNVAKFLSNSPDFDFQTATIDSYLQQNAAKSFQNIAQDQVAPVTQQLKSIQRVFRISPDYPTINRLLSAGLDSAAKISKLSRARFLQQYSASLGGDTQALALYSSASHINAQAINLHRMIQGSLNDVSPIGISGPSRPVPLAIQTGIPNWQTLFGSAGGCQCDDCLSVYSAAAYFVDLLEFLRHSAPNAAGYTPLDVLIGGKVGNTLISGRRPDLPYIKLNCQNTNTELPYVDLVNEILESYITLNGALDATTAHNTSSDATADELAVNPEYTLSPAYDALSGATYPRALPYDRFLGVARRYLGFLGGNRQQVVQLFQTAPAPMDAAAALAAEILGLSHEEFALIANWDYQLSTSATLPALYALYGYAAPNITRTVGSTSTTQSWEQWIANAEEFLTRTGLQFSDLVNLLETQFINPGQAITLSSPGGCDISTTVITPLTDTTLGNTLPFVRLWNKLGWSMADLDKVLAVLAPSGITRGTLLALAEVSQLQTTLNLSLAQLLALWAPIGTDGRDSLYITLFQNKTVLNPVDRNLQLAYRAALPTAPSGLPTSSASQITYDSANQQIVFTGAMTDDQWKELIAWAGSDSAKLLAVQNLYQMRWAKGTELAGAAGITSEAPSILAALRISADDLNNIRAAANLLDPTPATPAPVNLASLSQLYRYAILAQSLGLAISDLISLMALTDINPFQLATSDPITDQTTRFVKVAQTVQASRFSVAQLNFIYRAVSNPAAGVGPLEADVDLLVLTLQTGLQKIVAANAFAPDPNGKLLRQKLGVLLGGADLTTAMDLISGTAVYSASLAALPAGVSFTGVLGNIVSFDSVNQLLKIIGPMSDTVKTQLIALSPTASAYVSAVNNLYQQPRTLLTEDLTFLNTADATTQLINAPSSNVSDRYTYVLQNLLKYLIDSQSRSLVKQALGQALSLDAATTTLLLDAPAGTTAPALLNSQRDPLQPAVVDFLDAGNGGLLATYFSDVNLSVPVTTRIDPTVNVGAAGEIVSNPGGARWTGKIEAEFSEGYTFYVSANDGVRLWINEQLVIDQWSNQAFSVRTSPVVVLTAGQLYDVRLDYYNVSAAGVAILGWSSKSTSNNNNVLIPPTALFPANTFATLSRLYPIALLLSTFHMKANEVAYLSAHGADFVGVDPGNSANKVNFDLTKLPVDRTNAAAVDKQAVAFFDQWRQLNDLFTLRDALPSGNVAVFDIFQAATSSTSPTKLGSNTVSAVLAATGWNAEEFATLSGQATVNKAIVGFALTDADFTNVEGQRGTGLVRLKACLDLSARLGISTSQLFQWANNPPDSGQAEDIKNTVKAKYDDATWVTVGAPLNNQIRDDSKTALIAYVLNMPSILSLGYTTADELYDYFLIDVEMTSCRLTSRIVQASAAVQLFVQRCLLDLENAHTGVNAVLNVSPAAIDYNQWQWRQNYRVWQVQREFFIAPENWVDPSMSENASPFFQDLQTELQQGPVTADRAETAMQNYLKKVQEVARLEICGLYWEIDADPVTNLSHNIFHVFGRTFASPHNYYYRTYDNAANVWSPWEAVTADVEGDHLIPVIWNRRLHLFWPLFKEQTTPSMAGGGPNNVTVPAVSTSSSQTTPSTPYKNLEVQLAWSEYRDGGWTKKQVTVDPLIPDGFQNYQGDFDPSWLSFQAVTQGAGLTVIAYCWSPGAWIPFPSLNTNIHTAELPFSPYKLSSVMAPSYDLYKVGQFNFDGCSSLPTVSTDGTNGDASGDSVSFVAPANSEFVSMTLEENTGQFPLAPDPATKGKFVLTAPGPNVNVLNSTPSAYQLTFAQQFYPKLEMNGPAPYGWQPFFYADSTRTYFVTQETVFIPRTFRNLADSLMVVNPSALTDTANVSALPKVPIFDQQALLKLPGVTGTPAAPASAAPIAARIAGVAEISAVAGDVSAAAAASPAPSASQSALVTTGFVAGQSSLINATAKFGPWQQYFGYLEHELNFAVHRHPHICDFLKALNWQGVPGLMTLSNQKLGEKDVEPNTIFQNTYKPTSVVAHAYPSENVDFSLGGAYSIYNFEIFVLIPFYIAMQLDENLQFDDAEKYFRYILNLTSNSTDPIPSRYWNALPFYQDTDPDRIENLVTVLQYTGSDPDLLQQKADFSAQITAWEQNPFDPNLIARMRLIAYQKAVAMKFMDHRFKQADYYYAQYTPETVNEATLLYVSVAEFLGDKPVIMPMQGVVLDKTYNDLVNNTPGLDAFSDELVTMENLFPFSTDSASSNTDGSGTSAVSSIAQVPYFCIPVNDTLLSYWDKVEQRLSQIRHCQNISGQFQQLPLFAPPINPALLLQALAAGMDLNSALNDINAATPFYRFTYLLPMVHGMVDELRSMGSTFFSLLEKNDAEGLAMLHATQDTALQKAIRNVKQQQLNEANSNLDALNDSLQVTQARQTYYQGLVNAGLSQFEMQQITLLNQAQGFQALSQAAQMQGSQFGALPNLDVGLTGVGGSPTATLSVGGSQLAAVANFVAQGFGMMASISSSSANITGLQGGWDRRSQDWNFQLQTATAELKQIGDQIKAATARQTLAQADLDNQDLQITNASAVQDYLRTKFTSQALYDQLVSQLSATYFQCYQMTYDMAKRLEACFIFERMPDLTNYTPFVQFGYWDSLKKGLLAGERLYQDLKRLEIAYMDQNPRDFEITKTISLLLLDPVALINLKETGQCTVQFPEGLFDMDYPGHYLRRIKSISLTIPCVSGPYTSINCTLTMVSNKIRIDSTATNPKDYVQDSHFVTNFAASQSIATSTAQNDSGLFTVNFNDERYLPNEGAGVIATMLLSMPLDTNALDFETISDVLFIVKYTSRDAGPSMRAIAKAAAVLPPGSLIGASPLAPVPLPPQTGLTRLFSLRHEFPTDWYNFLNPLASTPDQTMTLNLTQERFPFRYRGKKIQIYEVDVFLILRDIYDPTTYSADGTPLGDYAAKGAAGALVVNVTPPKAAAKTAQLVSDTAILQRVPCGTIPSPAPPPGPPVPPAIGSLGAWTLTAKGTDIQNLATTLQNQVASGSSTLYRINPRVIEDIYFVCHFSTT